MKKIIKAVKDLTRAEYHAAYNLNMRKRGEMQRKLSTCRRNKTGTVVMIVDDNNKTLSWALVYSRYAYGDTGVQFYTRKNARRNGYGSLVAQEVRKIAVKTAVFPWDKVSQEFFRKNGMMV